MLIDKIERLFQEIKDIHASNAEELEALRIKYLSKKGEINALMTDFRNVAADQKREVGMRLNELKQQVQEKIAVLKQSFEAKDNGTSHLDLTRTAYPIAFGTRHPLSIVKNQIIDAGGTGNNLASIWLIVWSSLTTFGIYPKGTRQGLIHIPSQVIDLHDPKGGTFRGYRDRFQWNVGLCLRDPRYVVRIVNIDVDKLPTYGTASSQAADLMSLMNIATNRIHNIGIGKAAWYMNRTVREAWENQMLKNYHIQHTKESATAKWDEAYKMIPIRICDSLLNTEERVV